MTREEAKRRLLNIERCTPIHTREDVRDFEALEMAIQALEQEPSGDLISRQAVNEIINDIRDCISVEGYCAILERLKKLPSVTQKSETVTEFADRCRECGAKYGKLLKQAPYGDAISRQAVLKQLKGCLTGGETEYNYVKIHIDSIPSVNPQEPEICEKCLYAEETDGSHCYECVKGKSKFKPQERSRNEDSD